jgi:hypothetical protein
MLVLELLGGGPWRSRHLKNIQRVFDGIHYGWYELYGAISGILDHTIRWYEMFCECY